MRRSHPVPLRGKRMARLTFPLIPLVFLLLQVPDTVIRKVPPPQPTRTWVGWQLAAL